MEKLIAKISSHSTEMIVDAVVQIGGGNVSTEEMMVRAALIEVFEQREGVEAADALMEQIGM